MTNPHQQDLYPSLIARRPSPDAYSFSASPSTAAVVPVFGVTPGTIEAGDNATLSLQLSLSADPGYYGAQFTGGSATLYSGDGSSQIFNIGFGGTSRNYNFAFSYPDAGSYLPSFILSATYQQIYDAYVYLYTVDYDVFFGYGYYSCGFFSTCSYPIYQTVSQPIYGYRQFTANGSSSASGSYPLTVTPIPGALVLFATGISFLLAVFKRGKVQAV